MGDNLGECTLCGRDVEKLFLAKVEGTLIEVCESCGKYGDILEGIKPKVDKAFVKKRGILKLGESKEVLKSNYGQLIIRTRQKMGLSRKEFAKKINEKESIIRRIEMEEMIPDEKLKKKIEKFLKTSLTEKYEQKEIRSKTRRTLLTLGDVVEIE